MNNFLTTARLSFFDLGTPFSFLFSPGKNALPSFLSAGKTSGLSFLSPWKTAGLSFLSSLYFFFTPVSFNRYNNNYVKTSLFFDKRRFRTRRHRGSR